MNRLIHLIALLLLTTTFEPYAADAARRIVRVSDYGLQPEAAGTPCRSSDGSSRKTRVSGACRFVSTRGVTISTPMRSGRPPGKPTTVFALTRTEDVEIDGGGCDWIFHGLMKPVRLSECRNTTLRNVPHRLAAALQLAGDRSSRQRTPI